MNKVENIISVINYIEEHLSEKLTLSSIAKSVGYSKYHLHRIFSDTVQKIFRRMENMGKTFTPDLNSQFFDIGQRLSKRVGVVFETGFFRWRIGTAIFRILCVR